MSDSSPESLAESNARLLDQLQALRTSHEELRVRLEEMDETFHAIRNGEAEALIIQGENGPQIYSLASAETESNRFRGNILSQISEAVVAIDTHQRVTYFNAAAERMYGLSASDILGRNIADVWGPKWPFQEEEAIAKVILADAGRWRGESVHVGANGKNIEVEAVVTCIQDGSNAMAGMLTTLRDISQRRHAELALSHAAKRKDEFLAMLGHELRNPLAALRHAIQTAVEARDGATQDWARGVVDRQSTQLSRIVDDLLDVARINSGRISVTPEPTDMKAAIDHALKVVAPLITQKQHAISWINDGTPLWVTADPLRLEQVLVNLLSNACKYTPSGGTITLGAVEDGHEAVISVADNGIGIAPAILPHVFELFTQAETSLDRSLGGLGVGLSVVKTLVHVHGGQVTAESAGREKGSTFIVRLPLGSAPAPRDPALNGQGAHGIASDISDLRILIVDDHRDAASALARLLIRRNYKVSIAHDGVTALEMAKEFHPNVFLLDLGLPDIDGYALAAKLKDEAAFSSALYIAISGYAQEGDMVRSKAAGFHHHLAKPARLSTLLSLLPVGVME